MGVSRPLPNWFIDPLQRGQEKLDEHEQRQLGYDTEAAKWEVKKIHHEWGAEQKSREREWAVRMIISSKTRGLRRRIKDSTACHSVLRIPELLELILLHLPLKDLLLVQRVSRQFQAVWQGSVRIQRALFFLPEPINSRTKQYPTINPFFATKHFPFRSLLICREDPTSERLTFLRGVYMHKLAEKSPCRSLGSYRAILSLRTTSIPSIKGRSMRPKIEKLHFTGSWRKMLLSQPALPVWAMLDGHLNPFAGTFLPRSLGSILPADWKVSIMKAGGVDVRLYEDVFEKRRRGRWLHGCLDRFELMGSVEGLDWEEFSESVEREGMKRGFGQMESERARRMRDVVRYVASGIVM